MENYRIFLSYSHNDYQLAKKIAAHIKDKLGMTPLWDENLIHGQGFPDQIKAYIRHAHAFLPIITEAASNRGWVHEEIGYAMALNVPVLPLAVGTLPGAMIQHLHAILLKNADDDLNPLFTKETFTFSIDRQDFSNSALYSCADASEDRSMMMARFAEDVLRIGGFGKVRQRGGLSSFHIPNQIIEDPIWRLRYGGLDRGAFRSRLQRNERLALGHHASREGARLIVTPDLEFTEWGPNARVVRLESLVQFLSNSEDNIEIACTPSRQQGESVTIVGDWVYAESISGTLREGFRQTIFTCHAPTIRNKIVAFDERFAHAEQTTPGPGEGPSRQRAITYLQMLIADLKKRI